MGAVGCVAAAAQAGEAWGRGLGAGVVGCGAAAAQAGAGVVGAYAAGGAEGAGVCLAADVGRVEGDGKEGVEVGGVRSAGRVDVGLRLADEDKRRRWSLWQQHNCVVEQDG